MELYEAIINDVLCYNLEQHVAFVVRIKAPAYQMFNENTDAEFGMRKQGFEESLYRQFIGAL